MRNKQDIKKGRLCTRGGGGWGIPRWGCDVRFLNFDAILDQNMPFFIRLYAPVVPLETIPYFRLWSLFFGVAPTYIADIEEYPRDKWVPSSQREGTFLNNKLIGQDEYPGMKL